STVILFGLGSLHLDIFENIDRDAMVKMAILVVVLVAVAVLVIAVIPKLRRAVLGAWSRVWALVGPLLRSPRRFLTLLFANIAADMLFAFTMYITLLAFGQDVSYGDVIIVNDCVSLFAGLMPVPGGIGVTEAALTAGFISIGVDEATAFAVAITYRVLTYYTPPIIGFFAFRWLQRQRYL
ncbi:MAG TPA: lysylphosphatidylglycerol synthase transmembrane domain-containing protein, partial [Ilumatobacteraceae bacterium]|nr:lysylphosphatidylglycerol synthase transmembrane domain-containing protein [Ilumatobacteraceae bacterium]